MITLRNMNTIGPIAHMEAEEEEVTEDSKDHVGCHVEDHEEVPKDIEASGKATDKDAVIKEATTRTVRRSAMYVTKQAVGRLNIQSRNDNKRTTNSEDKPSIRRNRRSPHSTTKASLPNSKDLREYLTMKCKWTS
jgi:hypothetical protein